MEHENKTFVTTEPCPHGFHQGCLKCEEEMLAKSSSQPQGHEHDWGLDMYGKQICILCYTPREEPRQYAQDAFEKGRDAERERIRKGVEGLRKSHTGGWEQQAHKELEVEDTENWNAALKAVLDIIRGEATTYVRKEDDQGLPYVDGIQAPKK